MSRKIRYSGYSFASILTPAQILGANYYDHWRSQDLVLSDGDVVLNFTSVGLQANDLSVSTGVRAPFFRTNVFNGYPSIQNPVGGNRFMFVPSSTNKYNFLHNGRSTIIALTRNISPFGLSAGVLLGNSKGSSDVGIFAGIRRDFASFPNTVDHLVTRGVAGTGSVTNRITNVWNQNEFQLIIITLDNTAVLPIDRSEIFMSTNSSLKNNSDSDSFPIGNADENLTLFARAGVLDLSYEGDLLELIIADEKADNTQINNLIAWYNNKYNTTLPVV